MTEGGKEAVRVDDDVVANAHVRALEKRVRELETSIMTPRLHRIHHSVIHEEQDLHWSNRVTFWDRLHGTFRPIRHRVGSKSAIPVGVRVMK